MTLADDIETLRRGQRLYGGAAWEDACTRVIAILEPLAGLSDEQLEYLQSRAEMIGARRAHIPFKHGSWAALAAALVALRGK